MIYCATGKIDHVKLRTKYVESWDLGAAGNVRGVLEGKGECWGALRCVPSGCPG